MRSSVYHSYRPLRWIYRLLPGSYWAIAGLFAVIVYKCYLVAGARYLYEQTLREVGIEMKAAEKLSRIHGRGEAIYRRCNPDAKAPLPKDTLWVWLNEAKNALREEFRQEGVDEFLKSVNGSIKGSGDHRDIPTELHDQEDWMGAHLIALFNFIEHKRTGSIARRSTDT